MRLPELWTWNGHSMPTLASTNLTTSKGGWPGKSNWKNLRWCLWRINQENWSRSWSTTTSAHIWRHAHVFNGHKEFYVDLKVFILCKSEENCQEVRKVSKGWWSNTKSQFIRLATQKVGFVKPKDCIPDFFFMRQNLTAVALLGWACTAVISAVINTSICLFILKWQ